MLIFYGPCNNARDSEILVCIFAIFYRILFSKLLGRAFWLHIFLSHLIIVFAFLKGRLPKD